MDKDLMSICGAHCGECEWKEKTNCPGCQKAQGKMFWGQCQVAACAVEKGHKHCGHCETLPCEALQSAFDNPEHGDNGERLANLSAWAAGSDAYIPITKKKCEI